MAATILTPRLKSCPINKNKLKVRQTKLRSSIAAGTVLIVLTGPYKGKRVVFLKQLASGLLLVTGPYKVNGVPLRRINQRFVIATSTKIDVHEVDVKSVDDSMFTKTKEEKKSGKKTTEEFEGTEKKKVIPQTFVALQKKVDAAIIKGMKKDKLVAAYLKTSFTLTSGMKPHELKF
jgi:large subunit ribosomal protein L6e